MWDGQGISYPIEEDKLYDKKTFIRNSPRPGEERDGPAEEVL